MYQILPKSFNGLSIVLGRPSRFDLQNKKLLSANSGDWFKRELLKSGIKFEDCYLHNLIAGCSESILRGSKCILLLGEQPLKEFGKLDVTINEQRGSPWLYQDTNIPIIATYAPQETHDLKNYESKINPLAIAANEIAREEKDKDDDTGKAHGATKRTNFKFWAGRDIIKTARILNWGIRPIEPKLNILPSLDEACYELRKYKGQYLSYDIETDPQTNDITVLSFCFCNLQDMDSIPTTFVTPIRRYNYCSCYDDTCELFRSFAIALRDNIAVTWNGSGFDMFFNCWRYGIPFGRNNFDAMVSHHRIFPEVEKSLGHGISLYTDQDYHKNTSGTFAPNNTRQEMQLWAYNGTDTHTTWLCAKEIIQYAKGIKGLTESIKQANEMIYPYLMMTMTGMNTDKQLIDKKIKDNDRRVNQYLRILKILVGFNLNPRSNKQMTQYLFNKEKDGGLGYSPVSYTDDNKPACDAAALIRLAINYPENIVLLLILQIRRLLTEAKALMFQPTNY